jgi:hypothetical protein
LKCQFGISKEPVTICDRFSTRVSLNRSSRREEALTNFAIHVENRKMEPRYLGCYGVGIRFRAPFEVPNWHLKIWQLRQERNLCRKPTRQNPKPRQGRNMPLLTELETVVIAQLQRCRPAGAAATGPPERLRSI